MSGTKIETKFKIVPPDDSEPTLESLADRIETIEWKLGIRRKVYLCSIPSCENEAIDQKAHQQPSVCWKHDPGR